VLFGLGGSKVAIWVRNLVHNVLQNDSKRTTIVTFASSKLLGVLKQKAIAGQRVRTGADDGTRELSLALVSTYGTEGYTFEPCRVYSLKCKLQNNLRRSEFPNSDRRFSFPSRQIRRICIISLCARASGFSISHAASTRLLEVRPTPGGLRQVGPHL
jgi:hypothetical protein